MDTLAVMSDTKEHRNRSPRTKVGKQSGVNASVQWPSIVWPVYCGAGSFGLFSLLSYYWPPVRLIRVRIGLPVLWGQLIEEHATPTAAPGRSAG
jgi:hypothetical protein